MDQAIGTARDTAALARRVVLRTLTVVGGAAAGTAIAWCVSSASASADVTDGLTPAAPEVPAVHQLVSPVTGTLDTAVHATAEKLQDPPAPPKSLTELGERVKQAASDLGERAQEQLPACADPLCALEEIGRSEAPPAGDSVEQAAPAAAPHAAPAAPAAAKVTDPGIDPDATAEHTATGRAYSDGMSRRGSPAPGMPSFPGFPAAPIAPFPAPGNTGFAGSADSSPFAACPWQDRMPALVRGLAAPAGEVTTAGRPGAQPGVTPD